MQPPAASHISSSPMQRLGAIHRCLVVPRDDAVVAPSSTATSDAVHEDLDLERFRREGYLILRNVIPAALLDPLRVSAERALLQRWPDGIQPEQWQPMIHGLEQYVDDCSANLIDLCFHPNVLGPTTQLMGGAEVGLAAAFMMYNPVADHGPWWWHRDVNTDANGTKGPLGGLILDNVANGCCYLHFNIALWPDETLWVVPGSHCRPNTAEEDAQLNSVPHHYSNGQQPQGGQDAPRHTPLPGSVCVQLNAGDAIVNQLELFHWGSDYSPKHTRRTYHLGYRSFNGARFAGYEGFRNGTLPDKLHHFAPHTQAHLTRSLALYNDECVALAATCRAAIDKNAAGFRRGIAKLHPAVAGRSTALVHLSRMAANIKQYLNDSDIGLFTAEDLELLSTRFACVDTLLKTESSTGQEWSPGFQLKGPSRYKIVDMPGEISVDAVVQSWAGQ